MNSFRAYQQDSLWEIARWEANYKLLEAHHKCEFRRPAADPRLQGPSREARCRRARSFRSAISDRPFRTPLGSRRAYFPELPAVHVSARRAVANNAEFIAALLSTYEARFHASSYYIPGV